MVITRTPFRISFFGGGTDYPVYYQKHGGMVLSTTIDKYCYLSVRHLPPLWDYRYRIRYTDREETKTIAEIKHPSARECLAFLGLHDHRIEVQHNSDLPAMGGLGASSSFTTGLLHALYALKGTHVSKEKLAQDAIHVEQKMIGENVGSQDQVAAAFGGLNTVSFRPTGEIDVAPLILSPEIKKALEDDLLLVYTGQTRFASEIAAEQIKNTAQKEKELSAMKAMVPEASKFLAKGNLEDFGKMLHETWLLKRGLSSQITNSAIDQMYDAARSRGALGGKLLGAGGGGFLLLFADKGRHSAIKERLASYPIIPFKFENSGSKVIYHLPSEEYEV